MAYDFSFGQWLVSRRKELRLQRTELAAQIGCAVITLRKIEADERRPSQQLAELLADRLGLSTAERATFIRVARGELLVDRLPALPLIDHAPPAVHHALHPSAVPTPRQPSHPIIRTNLPLLLTSFVGRDVELEAIPTLLDTQRLVTLTGVGGVGKTRLALEVGMRLVKAATTERVRDGVWLVELAALAQPALVAQAIVRLFQIPEQPGRTTLELLQQYLADKQLLLILDNCEHLVEVCAELAEYLLQRCWQLRILATSREPLRIPGELAYPVVPLSLPDAMEQNAHQILSTTSAQLFIARMHIDSRAPNAGRYEASTIAQICRQLDGIPLALELAAPLTHSMPLAEIATQLHNQMSILTNTYRTAIPRHQTMHSALVWSYRLLAPAEQVLLANMAVFSGGWTLEAAQAVCSEYPTDQVLLILTQLIAKSLVLHEEKGGQLRYRLLEPVRQFAVMQLQVSGREDLVRRCHAAYFLALAEMAWLHYHHEDRGIWLDQLELELDNLRTASGWALAGSAVEIGARIVIALAGQHGDGLWGKIGYWDEGVRWLDTVLARRNALALGLRAWALLLAAFYRSMLGKDPFPFAGRQAAHNEALALFHAVDDQAGIAYVLSYQAFFVSKDDGGLQSIQLLEEALTLYQKLNDHYHCAVVLHYIGFMVSEQGDVVRAIALLKQSLALCRAHGYVNETAEVLNYLGDVACIERDIPQATAYYWEALALAQRERNDLRSAWLIVNLSRLALVQGDDGRVLTLLQQKIALFREQAIPSVLTMMIPVLGALVNAQGDHVQATKILRDGLIFLQQLSALQDVSSELSEILEAFAEVAIGQSQMIHATHLLGAAEACRTTSGTGRPPSADPAYRRNLAAAHALLDEEAYAVAWAEGQAMNLEQALAYALDAAAAPMGAVSARVQV